MADTATPAGLKALPHGIDITAPGGIDALLAFHRATFGDAQMNANVSEGESGETPPADGMPLPALLAEVQARENVAWFDEVNWDDDGYWEIEFGRQGGGKVEIRVDPITGDTLTR